MENLFFGVEVSAPWPEEEPTGRLIAPASRHVTLAFLGKEEGPIPEFEADFLGPAGVCNELLFLSNVVAYHIDWMSGKESLLQYRENLVSWLRGLGFEIDERPFLSHVTVARKPYDEKEWLKHFTPLPIIAKAIHLYKSVGNLTYEPIWSQPLIAPAQEIEHTGDIAYLVRGRDLRELFCNAELALGFEFPDFMKYVTSSFDGETLDEVIMTLNALGATFDSEVGSPFKGISFHGELEEIKPGIFEWEMIIDV